MERIPTVETVGLDMSALPGLTPRIPTPQRKAGWATHFKIDSGLRAPGGLPVTARAEALGEECRPCRDSGLFIARFPTVETVGLALSSHNVGLDCRGFGVN